MKYQFKHILLTALACVLLTSCSGLSPEVRKEVDAADKAYKEAHYDAAIAGYREILQKHGVSPEILFNLGNAYAQSDNYGQAVVCYERALRLDPGNKRVLQNLGYISQKIEDNNRADAGGKNVQVAPDSPTFFQNVYTWLAVNRSSDTWAILAAICFILAMGMVAIYIFARNVTVKKMGFFSALALIVVDVMLVAVALISCKAYNNKDKCVILEYKTPLYDEPGATSKAATTPLNAGTRVDIVEAEEDGRGNALWYKVRLNADFSGWIKADMVEII